MRLAPVLHRARSGLHALRRARGGIAMTEFALLLPVVTTLGLYGLECSNLVLANLTVSQIASNLADTASRIGETSGLAQKQIREADINDAFEAARIQGKARGVVAHGRITLSSLERNASGGPWIHWQRCIGVKTADTFKSQYGTAGDGATGTAFAGMGPAGEQIQAPADTAVMYAEVAYQYQPLISAALVGAPVVRGRAAFLVREPRDLDNDVNPANPDPAADASLCTEYGE
jgi:Flp pilus assembly protein TadG